MTGAALLLLSISAPAEPKTDLSPQTREQLRALQEEKAQRTPAQRKLDSQLVYARHRQQRGFVAAGLTRLQPQLRFEPDNRVLVDLRASVSPRLLDFIRRSGGVVVNSFARYDAIRALIPLELAETLAARPDVRFVRPADQAVTQTIPLSGGDIAHRANEARQTFGVDGTGIKVGVLSDSADYLTDVQAAGELPAVTVLPGQFGAGTGEGTAMMEIVNDLAPGAALYFATAFNGVASFAQNIHDLQAAGCQVIVDDVTYFSESPFQDGPIAQAVNDVCAAGTLYFSSAGNWGNKDKGTSSTWEGDFRDGGPATVGRGGRVHDFGGALYDTILPGGTLPRLDLFWADPLGQSTNDYDLYVLDANGTVLSSSANVQDGTGDPYETIPQVSISNRVVIVKYSGQDRYLSLTAGRSLLAIATVGSVRGHNAVGISNAFCVAATRVSSPPVAFTAGSTNQVESFSADGPRRIFFHSDGSAITPGNYSATGGAVLGKPDLTAADGVATATPGFAYFLGTSAAAPHAAAIAALLWSYEPSLHSGQVGSILQGTALDIETPGFDALSGAGIVMAYDALASAFPKLAIQSFQLQDANTNGVLDPNECADLLVTLRNLSEVGRQSATGITAVLSCSTPGIVVDPIPRQFADLPPDGTTTATAAFRISTSPSYACGTPVDFSLHIATSNQISFKLPINLSPAASGIGSPTHLDYAGPPLPIPDLGKVESSLPVSGFTQPLAKIKVGIYVTHTYDSDLRISLLAPDGTEVVLSANNGLSGQNYGASCVDMTLFSDDATNDIRTATAPFLGTFTPQQPLAAFVGKSGDALNGAWTLRVQDEYASDTGTLQCWWLELSPNTCTEGPGACLVGPQILANPTDLVATNGDTVTFTVIAQGTDPLSFQWWFNGTNLLAGETRQTLVLPGIDPSRAGDYSVTVSNLYGVAASAAAHLTVVVPPLIVTGPADLVVSNGDTAQFAVEASGSAPLGYQWYFNGAQPIPDATQPTLVLTAVNPLRAGTYTVVISNAYGQQTSAPATLTVLSAPFIVAAPTNQSVLAGQSAQFDVVALGTAPLFYQWWFNQTNLLLGATNASLVLSNLTPAQAGSYAVVVSNLYGQQLAAPATLAVATPPFITGQPVSLVTTQGLNPAFTVTVGGDGPLVYQWLFDGTPIAGAVQSTLSLTNVQPANAGRYQVIVTNTVGAATSQIAALSVVVLPTLECAGDRTVELGTPWTFDPPTAHGSNVTVQVVSTTTNAGCGATFQATRTWQVTDALGYPAVCSQTINVVDTSPPVFTSAPDKTVAAGSDWAFDPPTAVDPFVTEALAYDNSANDLSLRFQPGPLEIGNEIILDNSERYARRFSFEFWGLNPQTGDFEGNVQAQVRFYRNDGPPSSSGYATPGTVIFDSGPFPIPALPRATLIFEDFQIAALVPLTTALPDSFTWTVQFTGLATNDAAGLDLYSPPTVGRTYTDYWEHDAAGWSLKTNSLATINFGARLETVSRGVWVTTLSTVTNGSCGTTYSASREWQAVDACGNSSTTTQTVTVVYGGPPCIFAQPESQTRIAGETANFSVTAAGVPPLSYAWWHDQTNLVAEAADAMLVLTNVTAGDAGDYQVIVRDAAGSTTSIVATLTVRVPPAILQPPASLVVTQGQSTAFNVLAAGDAPLGYQWRFGGLDIAGATQAQLALANVQPTNAGLYGVVVSNALGSVTSAVATLTVVSPPQIVHGLADQVATNGDTVVFAVIAAGTEPIAYQWYFDSNNGLSGTGGTVLPQGTNAALALSNVSPAQAGFYSVRVSNPYGEVVSAPAHLAVVVPALILAGPVSQVVSNGVTAQFTVLAQGTAPLAYRWYYNTTQLLAGATGPILTLTNAGFAQSGTYAVGVSNAYGQQRSADATLTVLSPPSILVAPANQVATNGDRVEFSVMAQGTLPLTCQWWFEQTNLLTGATNVSLVLSNVTPAAAGRYAVAVSNAYGGVRSAEARLTVLVPPTIVTQPQDQMVIAGGTATFTVEAQGSQPLSYQWLLETNPVAGATNQTLTLTRVQPSQAGDYQVIVANAAGAVTSAVAVLTVGTPPAIVAQPQDQSVAVGGKANFSVTAYGTSPLHYQWLFYGTNIAGATKRTLTVADAQPASQGPYQVVITNTAGAITSAVATLTVLSPPWIVSGPTDVFATNGDTVQFTVAAQGTSPLLYQWWFNQTNSLPGATNAALQLTNVTPVRAGSYFVTVSNLYGRVSSGAAQLTVVVPATIIAGPTNQLATNGTTVQMFVQADGTQPLAYQWYFNSTQMLAGATGTALVLTNVGPVQQGDYAVTVSNAYGRQRSADARLTLVSPPVILAQPQSQIVSRGTTVTFTVLATGAPAPSYQWLFNDTNQLAGATNSTLTLVGVQNEDAGLYSVVVSNWLGSVTSAEAALAIAGAPVILVQPQATTAPLGGTAQFSVSAIGTPPLEYQWYFNTTNFVAAASSPVLVLTNLVLAQGGNYSVVVTNALGSAPSQQANLRILIPPEVLSITRATNVVTLSFSTVSNAFYTVQYNTNLATSAWFVLPKASRRIGTGSPIAVQDLQANGPERYYRILVE